MATWQLQEAKNKLSYLVDKVLLEGPQFVTRRDKPAVVIVSIDDFERMTHHSSDFKSFLKEFPSEDLDFSRSKSVAREIEF
jgi:antitoxin Phd